MGAVLSLDRLLANAEINGLPVLLRADLNIPLDGHGKARDASRLAQLKPSLTALAQAGARTAILSHFGRPKRARDPAYSLAPVAGMLGSLLGCEVAFAEDCIGEAAARLMQDLPAGGIGVLENTRFHAGEEQNNADFARALSKAGRAYVNDAFSVAHRAHASTQAIARILPSYAGYALAAELDALESVLATPARPLMAIIGGAKISSKISLLESLVEKTDILAIGGGMANSFLAAQGLSVGRSLVEAAQLDTARTILAKAEAAHCRLILPQDVMVAAAFAPCENPQMVAANNVTEDMMILDVGEKTVQQINAAIDESKTLVWNGPLGAFEMPVFDRATNSTAAHAAKRTAQGRLVSVAGGGDTQAALHHAGVGEDFTYISTAGGAFLEWLEGKPLPAIKVLENKE